MGIGRRYGAQQVVLNLSTIVYAEKQWSKLQPTSVRSPLFMLAISSSNAHALHAVSNLEYNSKYHYVSNSWENVSNYLRYFLVPWEGYLAVSRPMLLCVTSLSIKRRSRHAAHSAKALRWREYQLLKCLIKKRTLSK